MKICLRCGRLFSRPVALTSNERWRRQRYCSALCGNAARRVHPLDRLWARTAFTDSCHLWEGPVYDGYGRIRIDGRNEPAHRVAYEYLVGPVPSGLELDHLCRVRNCVNPEHLEPVTSRVNVLRSDGPAAVNARKDSCHRGHPFTRENTYVAPSGSRVCRACRQRATRRYRNRQKERAAT